MGLNRPETYQQERIENAARAGYPVMPDRVWRGLPGSGLIKYALVMGSDRDELLGKTVEA
jgi:hypothetical protein